MQNIGNVCTAGCSHWRFWFSGPFYPQAIVRRFFLFLAMSIPFSPTLKIFLPEEQTRACVCSRGAAAAGVVTRTEVPGEAGGGRALEADDLRSTAVVC